MMDSCARRPTRGASRLYLHCGLPRTGTTSLQAVLARCSGKLVDANVVYPEGWRPRGSDAHYGLEGLLEHGGDALAGFQDFLRSQSWATVLISCEALSNWLPGPKRDALIGFLRAASEVSDVTCLWTLRRLDRWAASMYLHMIETGRSVPSPEEYFRGWTAGVASVFAGLREVESCGYVTSVYLRYDRAGAHNRALLRAVGVVDPVREEIEKCLRDGPRRNRSSTLKRDDDIDHADDPCKLVDGDVAGAARQAAIEAARETCFYRYLDYFEA